MKDFKEFIRNNINEDINESLFSRKKNKNTAFKDENQQWDNWCATIIRELIYAFDDYKKKNPEYNPQTDEYPENFDEEIIKYANDKEDLYDAIYCLYRCYYNGDFTEDDLGTPGLAKVKFSD